MLGISSARLLALFPAMSSDFGSDNDFVRIILYLYYVKSFYEMSAALTCGFLILKPSGIKERSMCERKLVLVYKSQKIRKPTWWP